MNKMMEMIRYAFFGGITTVINLALFYLGMEIGLSYIVANVTSYIIAVIISYFLNNKFVFKEDEGNDAKKMIKFCVVRLGAIVVDTGLLALLVNLIDANVFYIKIILSITIIMATYVVNKCFVFNSSLKSKERKE